MYSTPYQNQSPSHIMQQQCAKNLKEKQTKKNKQRSKNTNAGYLNFYINWSSKQQTIWLRPTVGSQGGGERERERERLV